MTEMPEAFFRVCSRADWDSAVATGVFEGAAIDKADGFIHLSTGAQLAGTLAAHFGDLRDLVALTIDPALLGADLRWETSRGGQLFPHLYAPLNVAAVRMATPLPDDPDERAQAADAVLRSAVGQSARR